jgi:hypothetical protein
MSMPGIESWFAWEWSLCSVGGIAWADAPGVFGIGIDMGSECAALRFSGVAFFVAAFGVILFAAGFFALGFCLGAGFAGFGMVMPGICICAAAGVATKAAAPSRRLRDFRRNSFERCALGRSTEGAIDNARSAAAVLASAGVAGAAAIGRAAALLLGFRVFAIGHFKSPFLRCSNRANHHITSVPWYRVKQFNR